MGNASHQGFAQQHAATERWTRAVAAVHEADTKFLAVLAVFNRAERHFFDVKKNQADANAIAAAQAELDKAHEQDRVFGNAMYQATKTVSRQVRPALRQ